MKILVVDDKQSLSQMVAQFLGQMFTVETKKKWIRSFKIITRR